MRRFFGFLKVGEIPVGISLGVIPPGGRGGHPPRLPQNAACSFTALRSSEVGSQHYG
jgi:hypothetical protein